MMDQQLTTPPIAIFGFNRPASTVRVFERVRAVKPSKLFLCLDAPRVSNPADIEKCLAVKRIFDEVDWPCTVYKNYAVENMGCRARMGSGISWVFEYVPEAIILEDDCVPDITFFPFCAELLKKYRDDMRIGMIAGHVAHLRKISVTESYYFDRLNTIWGWATWRRAWCKFDVSMTHWPRFRQEHGLRNIFEKRAYVKPWMAMFDAVYDNQCSSWATAWALTCMRESMYCIHPTLNLITNIGCGVEATHSHDSETPWSCVPLESMDFPLTHPVDVLPNRLEENKTMRCLYVRTLADRLRGRLRMFCRTLRPR